MRVVFCCVGGVGSGIALLIDAAYVFLCVHAGACRQIALLLLPLLPKSLLPKSLLPPPPLLLLLLLNERADKAVQVLQQRLHAAIKQGEQRSVFNNIFSK